MHKTTKLFIIGFTIANAIWFTFIMIISSFEALPSVIFWAVIQTLIIIWLSANLEFFTPIHIDKTSNMIHAYGKEIPISSIHYAEVVHFVGCYDGLALGYMSKKEKPVVNITGECKNFKILEFCNKLRRLKQMPEQKRPKYYPGGQIFGYYRWKRKIKTYVQRKHNGDSISAY